MILDKQCYTDVLSDQPHGFQKYDLRNKFENLLNIGYGNPFNLHVDPSMYSMAFLPVNDCPLVPRDTLVEVLQAPGMVVILSLVLNFFPRSQKTEDEVSRAEDKKFTFFEN